MTTSKHRFFCEDITSKTLSEDESNHAAKVLRLQVGNQIELFDGKGNSAMAIISQISKKSLHFTFDKIQSVEPVNYDIHIGIAPTKNIDRFVFFMEKCTEIGITQITPILTQKSERRDLKLDKLKKNLISAAKQSGNLMIPQLNELTKLSEFISTCKTSNHQKFIAHCAQHDDKQELKSLVHFNKKVIILIGPEGDFTSEEVNLATANHFKAVSLGTSRLRTETAGIVACHTVHLI